MGYSTERKTGGEKKNRRLKRRNYCVNRATNAIYRLNCFQLSAIRRVRYLIHSKQPAKHKKACLFFLPVTLKLISENKVETVFSEQLNCQWGFSSPSNPFYPQPLPTTPYTTNFTSLTTTRVTLAQSSFYTTHFSSPLDLDDLKHRKNM